MSYQDLHYLILKLLTKNFGIFKFNKAQGLRGLGLQEKISVNYFHCTSLQKDKERFPWVFSFVFSSAEKLNKTCLMFKFIIGGSIT